MGMEEMKNNVGNLAQITANLEASAIELEVREKTNAYGITILIIKFTISHFRC